MSDDDHDAVPNDGREETPNERYDRNWSELLQEFRVFQTGTQILAAFLLTLPFQQRFTQLEPFDVVVYLILIMIAAAVTLLALAPVALHRMLFRKRAKKELVEMTNRILLTCLAAASVLFPGIVLFIFDFLLNPPAGAFAGAVVFVLVILIWIVVPLSMQRAQRAQERASEEEERLSRSSRARGTS
jgi:hypothetical protein